MKKRLSLFLAAALGISFLMSGCSKTSPSGTAQSTADVEETMEENDGKSETEAAEANAEADGTAGVRLEDDYFDYINGELLSKTEIPSDSNNWSYFYKLNEDVLQALSDVMQETVDNRKTYEKNSVEQQISDLYLTAVDMEGREKAGFGGLASYLDDIRNAATIDEYIRATGRLSRELGFGSIFLCSYMADLADSNSYGCYLDGADLGLGKERLENPEMEDVRKNYEAYIDKMLGYAGFSSEESKKYAEEILNLQKDLAASSLSLADSSNPDKVYNPMSAEKLQELFTNVDTDVLLEAYAEVKYDTYIVADIEQMKKIDTYLTEENLPLLKSFSIYCALNDMGAYLTPEIRDTYIEWNNSLNGVKEKKTDEKLAAEMVKSFLGFEMGEIYVDKYFSEEAKEDVKAMTEQLIAQYKTRIQELDWMSEETKKKAVQKLETMDLKIGYPDVWPDRHKALEIAAVEDGGSLIDNMLAILRTNRRYDISMLDKPVDKTQWSCTPQTVNAYYNPLKNDITFPAAILQAPFYDPDSDYASKLGGIGMIIAHEISHAFDNDGALYDETGNYNMWWTEEDLQEFQKRSEKVVAYYDKQDGFQGHYVNGRQTLGENIADLGAMSCITSVAESNQEDLDSLFRQYAVIWASKYTDESMLQRLDIDVHSPAKVRVNAVLSATDLFYETYQGIKEGDGMYVAPEDRPKIW